MGVSENRGTPKSSILIRFSIINHPFWGTPIFGNTHIQPTGYFDLIMTDGLIFLFSTSQVLPQGESYCESWIVTICFGMDV